MYLGNVIAKAVLYLVGRKPKPSALRFDEIRWVEKSRLEPTGKVYCFTVLDEISSELCVTYVVDEPVLSPRVKALANGDMEFDSWYLRDKDGELRHGRVKVKGRAIVFDMPEECRQEGSRLWLYFAERHTRLQTITDRQGVRLISESDLYCS